MGKSPLSGLGPGTPRSVPQTISLHMTGTCYIDSKPTALGGRGFCGTKPIALGGRGFCETSMSKSPSRGKRVGWAVFPIHLFGVALCRSAPCIEVRPGPIQSHEVRRAPGPGGISLAQPGSRIQSRFHLDVACLTSVRLWPRPLLDSVASPIPPPRVPVYPPGLRGRAGGRHRLGIGGTVRLVLAA